MTWLKTAAASPQALADVVQRPLDRSVRQIFDKFLNGRVRLASQTIDRRVRLQIVVAGSLSPQVSRHEFTNLGQGAVGPPGPNDVDLLADPFQRAPRTGEKIAPVDYGSAQARVPASASSTWRNQIRQPRPSGRASTLERQGDLKRRSQLQNRANAPPVFAEHRRPEGHKAAHPWVFDDRKAGVLVLLCKGRYRALLQRERFGRVNAFRIELAPVISSASCRRENVLIQGIKNGRFPVSLGIGFVARYQITRGGASEPGHCSGQTRGATAMHS